MSGHHCSGWQQADGIEIAWLASDLGPSSQPLVLLSRSSPSISSSFFSRSYNKKSTLTSREIQTGVRLLLPGELAKHAVAEGTKAVVSFFSRLSTGATLRGRRLECFSVCSCCTAFHALSFPSFVSSPLLCHCRPSTTLPPRKALNHRAPQDKTRHSGSHPLFPLAATSVLLSSPLGLLAASAAIGEEGGFFVPSSSHLVLQPTNKNVDVGPKRTSKKNKRGKTTQQPAGARDGLGMGQTRGRKVSGAAFSPSLGEELSRGSAVLPSLCKGTGAGRPQQETTVATRETG